MMKYFFIQLLLGCFFTGVCANNRMAQTTVEDIPPTIKDTCYIIGNYWICPAQKTISTGHMIGGEDWDGYAYSPDTTIHYESTSLVVCGNIVDFREKFSGIDFRTLKPLSLRKQFMRFMDQHGTYYFQHGTRKEHSLDGMKHVRGGIYQDDRGNLFYIDADGLQKLLYIGLDMETVVHIADAYFMDKNGLHHVAYSHYDEDTNKHHYGNRLEVFEGAMPAYEAMESYIVVGDNVYARTIGAANQMDLDPKQTAEYLYNTNYETYLITDGNKAYIFSKFLSGDEFQEIPALRGVKIQSAIHLLAPSSVDKHTKNLRMGGKGNSVSVNPSPIHFISDKGIYMLAHSAKITKYARLSIFNPLTSGYELFDYSSFTNLGNGLYVYQGKLYNQRNEQVNIFPDPTKLQLVKNNWITTYFYTDGQLLLYNGRRRNIHMADERYVKKSVDVSSLSIIEPHILMDKDCFYFGTDEGITSVSRKDLDINVEIYK